MAQISDARSSQEFPSDDRTLEPTMGPLKRYSAQSHSQHGSSEGLLWSRIWIHELRP
ncbi:hypothetical protein SNOG_09359 [Parastagonospora nodorum SN15]|uniref:Uncharacterized protein n=1 Tax=Phaeosphaeria nodorum (strain SN15 / ATCC MYA-4574 / FGSC 10173) TaxID=321614 RepID=Q0UFV5_PHANO|nr:hypothetical protein SNOG_09359 [Parastagonospora nodorum SN15]EAT83551.1 hypothetical protein SNOG_09359 [Parastagonospora nodorum SN15]